MSSPYKANKFNDILITGIDHDSRQRIEAEAAFMAFYTHLYRQGYELDHGLAPELHIGQIQISMAAFYNLEGHGKNPVNKAALKLLPRTSLKTYDEGQEKYIDNSGLRGTIAIASMDQLEATRRGEGARFIVGSRLGLAGSPATDMLKAMTSRPGSEAYERAVHMNDLVGDILHDFDDRAVGKVDEIYEYTQTKGYVDYFDYLVDVKQTALGRIATLFAHEAQNIPL